MVNKETVYKIPDSDISIIYRGNYTEEQLVELSEQISTDENFSKKMRANPLRELRKIGIVFAAEDNRDLTNNDILTAIGPYVNSQDQMVSHHNKTRFVGSIGFWVIVIIVWLILPPDSE